ncbi:hypothetical protein [Nocardiopsis sp. CNT312]|uniref:hypothetical protein n=1 Tax=Nocardiopsis sp. CNT312 TaxID=1137268 RepID=UPI0004B0D9EE|nr:hypothetical protein [Nocardiopsis sp. CNT312]
MAHSSRAVLRSALETLEALLLPARGRHARPSPTGTLLRRRSARVRRYAPVPAPEQTAAPAPAAPPVPAVPSTRPGLAPPTVRTPARDAALVRPYYTAYERELAYTQVHPARRLRARATIPGPRGPRLSASARRGTPYTPTHAAPAPVPAPRPAGDLLAPPPPPVPGEFDELARLVRLWQDQRADRRSGVAA